MSAHARTIHFQSLLSAAAIACGLDPARLGPVEGAALAEHLTKSARQNWRVEEWPGTIAIEDRAFHPAFDSGHSYSVGDKFYDATGDAYRKVIQSGTGAQMLTAAYSEPLTEFIREISRITEGKNGVGELLSAWDDNPELKDSVAKVGYHLRGDSIVFAQSAPNVVWLRFRLPTPEFTLSTWNSATNYAAGDLAVVWPHCYMALEDSTGSGQGPASAADRWEKQTIPEVIRELVVTDAARAWLKAAGRYAQAGALRGDREDAFDQASATVTRQQGQQHRYTVANGKLATHRRHFQPRAA